MRGMKDCGSGERQGATTRVGGAGDGGQVCGRTANWRHISEGSGKDGWYFSMEACSARASTHKHC